MSKKENLPQAWADPAMFPAEAAEAWEPTTGVQPRVHLLSMNADPLGDIASMCMMYEGKVARSMADVSDEDRIHYFEEMQKSHLQTPFESVQMHFLLEGVDRAFTHQLVRIRLASFAQESLRFAVVGRLAEATTLPPSLLGTTPSVEADDYDSQQQKQRATWDHTIEVIDRAYHRLVDGGMPAEEARGLLPTAVATRIHFRIDLHSLIHHAGNRLCTQASMHWRSVFVQIVQEINDYGMGTPNAWQFERIAQSGMFKPVCFQIGHCPFMAIFDRYCSIRERVEEKRFDEIRTEEWLLDPMAARAPRA